MDLYEQKFLTTPLNPHLLSTPFAVHTSWHVITGAPCSGKTTLIELLAQKGYPTVPEVGRQYIEREIVRGRTLEDIRLDKMGFDRAIRELTLQVEQGLRPEESLFLDRAFPDSLTFHRLHGVDPNEILLYCFHHHYASVFVLDRFPVQKDCARVEDDLEAHFIDEWLFRDYSSLGYPVLRVPVLPPAARLSYILERLPA